MVHVVFQWKDDVFGASFETEAQAQKAYNWLVKKYPGAKIKEIKEFRNDGPTIRKLHET